MQQTDKYKLNLIERTDPFSPDALNENTQKMEDALKTKAGTAETGQQFAALAARVTTLEGKKIAIGTYTGNGDAQTPIQFPFAPSALVIQLPTSSNSFIVMQGVPLKNNGTEFARLEGAELYAPSSATAPLNYNGMQYSFLAFPQ